MRGPLLLLVASAAACGSADGAAPSFADPSRTRVVAVGDFDRDGRPDLVTAGKHFLRLWRTTGGHPPGITLTLDGPGGGLGARVEVEVDGVTRTTWALPSTTGSSSAPEVYRGLRGAAAADRVVVTWPGGGTTEGVDVPAGPLVVDAP